MTDIKITDVALYSYWRSSCSWRVRIALEWKALAYEYRAVHLVKGEQRDEAYAQLNPNQRVPTLVIDGYSIAQSGAILEYLEETRPENRLLPLDPILRADVRNLCGLIGCDIMPVQNVSVLAKATEGVPEEEKLAKKTEWAKFWIERGFHAVERELRRTAGAFCVGDNVTMADLYLVPQIYNANRFEVDMTAFPIISRVAAALEPLPAFQRAHPSQQPDAVAA